MYISQNESFDLQEDAAFLISRLADGGMRDALSILDQCIAYSENVDIDIVSKATGLVLRDYLFNVVDMIEQKDASNAISCVDKLYQQSKDLQRFVSELIEHYRNLMIVKSSDKPENLVKCLPDELDKMKIQAQNIPMTSIMRYLTVLQDCLDKIGRNFDKRLSLEMALIKLCSADMDNTVESLLDRIERLEISIKNGIVVNGNTEVNSNIKKEVSTNAQEEKQSEIQKVELSKPQPTPIPVSAKEQSVQQDIEIKPLDVWPEIIKMLTTTDQMIAMVLRESTAFVGGDSLFISSDSEMFTAIVKKDNFTKKLKEAIYQKTGKNYKLKIKKSSKPIDDKKDILDEMLSNAQNMGIEIDEK